MPPRNENIFEAASIGHFVNLSDLRISDDALGNSIRTALQTASEELRNYKIFIVEPEETSKEVIEEWKTLIE